jgi:hypothetical protein
LASGKEEESAVQVKRYERTYQLILNERFIEPFELAEPKGVFEVYSKVRLIKQL